MFHIRLKYSAFFSFDFLFFSEYTDLLFIKIEYHKYTDVIFIKYSIFSLSWNFYKSSASLQNILVLQPTKQLLAPEAYHCITSPSSYKVSRKMFHFKRTLTYENLKGYWLSLPKFSLEEITLRIFSL